MSDKQSRVKRMVVLASQDHAEAMRVATGLSIFGHHVELVFVDRVVKENLQNSEQAEALALSGIEPVSLVGDPNIDQINRKQLRQLLMRCHHVVNI